MVNLDNIPLPLFSGNKEGEKKQEPWNLCIETTLGRLDSIV